MRSAGHLTAEAATAAEALTLLESERFDAAVVDYSLPDIDGMTLARRITASHPHLGLVFASGYGDLIAGASDLAACVLTKPFTDQRLKQAVLMSAQRRREADIQERGADACS